MRKIVEHTFSDAPEPACLRATLVEDLGYLLAHCWLDRDRANTAIARDAAAPERGGVDRAGGANVQEAPGERRSGQKKQ